MFRLLLSFQLNTNPLQLYFESNKFDCPNLYLGPCGTKPFQLQEHTLQWLHDNHFLHYSSPVHMTHYSHHGNPLDSHCTSSCIGAVTYHFLCIHLQHLTSLTQVLFSTKSTGLWITLPTTLNPFLYYLCTFSHSLSVILHLSS